MENNTYLDNLVDTASIESPIFGLTAGTCGTLVAASYFEPGFHVLEHWKDNGGWRVCPAQGGRFDISEDRGYELDTLFGRRFHTNPGKHCAQVAQLVHEDLLYLSGCSQSIGRLRINGDMQTPFHHRPKHRIEYFYQFLSGEIVTIENRLDCEIVVYRPEGDELHQVVRQHLKHSSAFQSDRVDYVYGLAEHGSDLLMMTDERSSAEHGIYAIDLSKGLVSQLHKRELGIRFLPEYAGLTGNGIAPVDDGLLVSSFRFMRGESGLSQDISGSSIIRYIPDSTTFK